ncbi:MAG: HD domain-containing protein [Nanoarchaeota archaeon]|nr:HD domain-containing protein [Nanoarchaeota archaeon]MBU1029703.1 HD domain-containing protein [Nanoarchaeota archaeon]MBU1850108.1 HD domain-containing protein [Nanoarchaeota archaeon]
MIKNNVVKEVKSMILDLCADKDFIWKSHIESVVKYSKILAKKLGADEEVCEVSAWLHDIKKVKGEKGSHHIEGSKEAAEILKGYEFSQNRINKVMHCIISHSSDKNYAPKSKEARIVASADALAHFDNFLNLAYVAFYLKKYSVEEGRAWLIKKYDSCWDKLVFVPEAVEIAKPKYKLVKKIIGL